ncbi:MAG TPA: hypothetical protein VK797_02130 [Tepidisphaeraceae bacterium]|nr:hypothetical protein [Tepidisphaeraceae bacterium]
METPQQQVRAFLKEHRIPESREVRVSKFFAESMLLELQGALNQWQAMLESIQQAEEEMRRSLIERN